MAVRSVFDIGLRRRTTTPNVVIEQNAITTNAVSVILLRWIAGKTRNLLNQSFLF